MGPRRVGPSSLGRNGQTSPGLCSRPARNRETSEWTETRTHVHRRVRPRRRGRPPGSAGVGPWGSGFPSGPLPSRSRVPQGLGAPRAEACLGARGPQFGRRSALETRHGLRRRASRPGALGPALTQCPVLGPGVPGRRVAHRAGVRLRERAALEERRAAAGVRVGSWETKAKQTTSKQPAAGSH